MRIMRIMRFYSKLSDIMQNYFILAKIRRIMPIRHPKGILRTPSLGIHSSSYKLCIYLHYQIWLYTDR